jgi:hypothetical protein
VNFGGGISLLWSLLFGRRRRLLLLLLWLRVQLLRRLLGLDNARSQLRQMHYACANRRRLQNKNKKINIILLFFSIRILTVIGLT